MRRLWLLALLTSLPAVATAAPLKLRLAALAPEGTAWARELEAMSRDVDSLGEHQVALKWYLGGIAGDELTVVDRIRRGQLDGSAGAGFCEHLAPSLRVTRLVGLLQGRDELRYVLSRMRSRLDEEMAKSGFVALSITAFGTPILMTRQPVRTMDELRKTRLWVWNEDEVAIDELRQMGLNLVPASIDDAAAMYADGRTDGFVSIPMAALAYQWSTQARYFTDLPIGFLPGCIVIAQRSFQALGYVQQNALKAAGAKLGAHFEANGQADDAALLGGLFEKQGMKRVPVSDAFRAQFREAARQARDSVARELIAPELVRATLGWLADYRGEH